MCAGGRGPPRDGHGQYCCGHSRDRSVELCAGACGAVSYRRKLPRIDNVDGDERRLRCCEGCNDGRVQARVYGSSSDGARRRSRCRFILRVRSRIWCSGEAVSERAEKCA